MPACLLAAALLVSACASVPGETTASRSQQRDARERVLALARSSDPQCKQHKFVTTEIVDVYADGRSAEELWTVDQCGQRVNYVVAFPLKGTHFSVRQAR